MSKKKLGLAVREFKAVSHFNMTECGLLNYAGYLDYPGHELDGKQIFKTVKTPKLNVDEESGMCDYGEPEVTYSVEDGGKEPLVFTDLVLLMNHYNLQPVER